MTLDPSDKTALSNARFEKAQNFLEDARANAKSGRINTAINRSYFASLNAVRALLILDGVNPESHAGAITMLSLRFIKTKILPVDIVRSFKTLLSRRSDADYGDFETLEQEDAEKSVREAERIIDEIDKIRRKMIEELE